MNKYIYTLLIISVISGLINSFISSFGSIKKYVDYFIGLLIVVCLMSPIIDIVGNISSLKNNISEFVENLVSEDEINSSNEIIINAGVDAIKNGIKKEIADKFGLDEKEILIELDIDKGNIESIKIKQISIILTGKASWSDVDTVKDHLEKIIGGNISVKRR